MAEQQDRRFWLEEPTEEEPFGLECRITSSNELWIGEECYLTPKQAGALLRTLSEHYLLDALCGI